MRLVTDQHDLAVKALAAQGFHDIEPGVAGADYDYSFRHSVFPQEIVTPPRDGATLIGTPAEKYPQFSAAAFNRDIAGWPGPPKPVGRSLPLPSTGALTMALRWRKE
jgi:hypothetical protein